MAMTFFNHPTAFHNAPLDSSFRSAALEDMTPSVNVDDRVPPHSLHPSLPHLTLLVFEAVLDVVCVSLPGYVVARQGMFSGEMQKFTANLNVSLFTPCLIFAKLASKLTVRKMTELAIIPVIFVAQTLISYVCSRLVSKFFRFTKRPRNFVVAMAVFGNSNSLPISLVISLSQTISGLHWDKVKNDNDNEVQARGILYLLIFQQLGQILRWSWGYNVLLAPPDDTTGTPEHTTSALEAGEISTSEERQRLLPSFEDRQEEEESHTSSSEETHINEDGPTPQAISTPRASSELPLGSQSAPSEQQNNSSASSLTQLKPDIKVAPAEATVPASSHNIRGAPLKSLFSRAIAAMCRAIEMLRIKSKEIWRCGLTGGKAAVETAARSTARRLSATYAALPRQAQSVMNACYSASRRATATLWAFMNPPLWAMFAAIIVASIPELQYLFFAEGTFLKNSVTSAINQSGAVAVPLILVVLGANLARNTLPSRRDSFEDPREETKLLVASLLSRMLLPFLIMAPLLALAAKHVPVSILDDPIFVIVCFLLTGAPSALQLAQICQLNNVYVGAMARLLFQSYVVWILPSTLMLVLCALEVVEWAKQR